MKFITVGRGFGKTSMLIEFAKRLEKLPTEKAIKLLRGQLENESSEFLRYRFPEEDKRRKNNDRSGF